MANLPGEYGEYPTMEKYAKTEETNTSFPFSWRLTMRFDAACM